MPINILQWSQLNLPPACQPKRRLSQCSNIFQHDSTCWMTAFIKHSRCIYTCIYIICSIPIMVPGTFCGAQGCIGLTRNCLRLRQIQMPNMVEVEHDNSIHPNIPPANDNRFDHSVLTQPAASFVQGLWSEIGSGVKRTTGLMAARFLWRAYHAN